MSLAGSATFHLTARPWAPSSVTSSQFLARIKGELSYFAGDQQSNGSFLDHYTHLTADARVTAQFAFGAATLAAAGDSSYLSQALKAMDYGTAEWAADGPNTNDGPDFALAPLVKAYMLLKAGGQVSSGELAMWATSLSHAAQPTTPFLDTNWSTYDMDGIWLQYKAGLIGHSQAVSQIEGLWNTYQSARFNSANDGLYIDATPTPDSLNVEAVGRGNFTDLSAQGYDGPSASAMAALVQQGGGNSLLMESPSGEVPLGGRVTDHVWVYAGYEAIDATLAATDAASNRTLAGQYLAASNLSFGAITPYARGDGSYSVTSNQYGNNARVGYQQASNDADYNSNVLLSTTTAYTQTLAAQAAGVTEAPATSQIGGYVYTTPATFAATFAAAGGVQVEIETLGRPVSLQGQAWNALGIDRIARVGWDSRLGPMDGIYDLNAGRGMTFAPTWLQNGGWTRLADHAANYSGTVTTQLATPVLTIVTVTWSGAGPTFTQKLIITPDGVLSEVTESGGSLPFGMTLPLLHFDGKTTLTQTIGNGIASVAYSGGLDAENYITLDPNTALTVGSDLLSAPGQLTPVQATSSSATQDTFVYQSGAGDPSAASVKSGFSLNANGYTSGIGWVNGTLYAGRTSAGGYGSSIALSGSGIPDVTFSAPVTFILQISNGVITSVETDAAVSATIEGVHYSLGAHSPLTVASAQPSPPTISLGAPGTVAEVPVGAGVTITEAVSATGVGRTIYAEVMTASGTVESGFQAVSLDANGLGSFSAYLAKTGDYVVAVDSTTTPTVTANSSPVTITDPAQTGPGVVTVSKPQSLVAGQVTFTGVLTSGVQPSVVKFAWHGGSSGETASSPDMVVATLLANGTYSATVTIDHPGLIGYFFVASDNNVAVDWSGVPLTQPAGPTISLSAPGSVQEASPGVGVTVTEAVSTTNLTGTIYEEVMTASGTVESGFKAVSLDSNGQASFSVHFASSGDYVVAVDNTTTPTVTADSAAVTITDAPPGPTVVTVAKPTTLVLGQDTFDGIVTGGQPSVVKFAWHGGSTGETASSADMVVATRQSDGSYSAVVNVDHLGLTGYFFVAVDGNVTLEWSGVPVSPSAAPTISLSAPGSVQEASPGVGVTVTETVSTTNLTGTIYEEVMTASGTVESGFKAVSLDSNGQASFSVHFANSGDYVVAVDNTTTPTVTADSAAITITDATQITGLLDNRGNTISAGSGTVFVLNGGTVVGGTIADSGGGFTIETGTLEGVSYLGALNIGSSDLLAVSNGLTVQTFTGGNPGTIAVAGGGSTLSVLDSETLDHATLLIGDASGTTDVLRNGGPGGSTLTLGAGLIVQQTVGSAQILSGAASDATINRGQIVVSGGTLDIGGGSFTNAGLIAVSGGGTVMFEPGSLANFAASTLTGGVYVIGGGSTLQMARNTFVLALAADVKLAGINSQFQSLNSAGIEASLDSTLRTISASGALRLLSGRSLALKAAFLDQGVLQLGGGTLSTTATTTVTGTLYGYGRVSGGLTDNGLIEANGGTLTIVNIATGSGTAQIDAGATLELATTSALATAFNGSGGTLLVDKPTTYSGTIGGLAIGDTIALAGVTASSASITGNTLDINLTTGKTLSYALGGSLSGLVAQTATGGGSSLVTFAAAAVRHASVAPIATANLSLAPAQFLATPTAPLQTAAALVSAGATLSASDAAHVSSSGVTADLTGHPLLGATSVHNPGTPDATALNALAGLHAASIPPVASNDHLAGVLTGSH